MLRTSEYLRQVSREKKKDYFISLQIHDEIVFDMPKGSTPSENLPIALECKRLMNLSGTDIGIPLSVDVSFHPENWSKKIDVEEILNAAV